MCIMNQTSKHLTNVILLRFLRVVVITLWINICNQYTLTDGKVFERCELAQLLRYGHGVDVNEVANWVCIAQRSSSLNTSAFGGTELSGSHGLFQISDEYWCSPPGKGLACGIECDRLRDDDISDDFECVKMIYDEQQRLSGDGFNAWAAYQTFCKDNPYEYIEECFGEEEQEYLHSKSKTAATEIDNDEEENNDTTLSGKVYERCELAKELLFKHMLPMDQISTWVCIAHRESSYNTSVVGRLNADGSRDHGLFQISDLFWCSHKGGSRKACGVRCSKFLDSDITDDVNCVKQIHEEHTKLFGDGFNAWAVHKPFCQDIQSRYVIGCFDEIETNGSKSSETTSLEPISDSTTPSNLASTSQKPSTMSGFEQNSSKKNGSTPSTTLFWLTSTTNKPTMTNPTNIPFWDAATLKPPITTFIPFWLTSTTTRPRPFSRGKFYARCDLPKELFLKHKIPIDEIPSLVCIALRESNYNTPVVGSFNFAGRQNYDQLNDFFWCLRKGGTRKTCGMPCYNLLNSDIVDDVNSVKQIHKDHTYCQDTYAKHIRGCFDGIDTEFIKSSEKKLFRPITNHTYSSNAFLKPYAPLISSAELKRYSDSVRLSSRKSEDVSKLVYVNSGYSNNPFLKEALSKLTQATTSSTPGAGKAFAWSIPLEYSKQSYQSTNDEKASSKSTTTDAKPFAWSIPSEYSLQSSQLDDKEKVNGAPTPAAEKVFVLHKPFSTNSLQPYKPMDEERAKHEVFKAFSTPSQPIFSISPRINRLWPHKLNTFKTFHTSPIPSSQALSTTMQTNQFKFRQWNTEKSTTEPTRLLVTTANQTTSSNIRFFLTSTTQMTKQTNNKASSITSTNLPSTTKKQKTTEIPVSLSSIALNQGTTSATLEPITLSAMTTTPISSTLTIAPKSTTVNSVEAEEEENDGIGPRGKVFERCELAREFLVKHKLPMDQISTWVCIAHRESNYNTSVVGRLNADGSNDHGLFQISDLFWCSHKGGSRKACGVSCSKFLDSDITDDVECVKKIHDEHTGISGDGFNAWAVYKPYCQGTTSQYLRGCFDESDSNFLKTTILKSISESTTLVSTTNPPTTTASRLQQNQSRTSPRSLVASTSPTILLTSPRATTLQLKSSTFTTNTTKTNRNRITAAQMELSTIKTTTKKLTTKASAEIPVSLSSTSPNQSSTSVPFGLTFAALEPTTLSLKSTTPFPSASTLEPKPTTVNSVQDDEEESNDAVSRGKVYGRCELAREFLVKHKLPMDQISTWVCIAHRESNYNTSVVGRLNADGSNDHGLFQISDLFWCSHKGGRRKACGVSCTKFLDSDITDDVECVRKIHDEHTGISGDGFNAWAVYKPYCQGSTSQYIRGCFDESDNENSKSSDTTDLKPISGSMENLSEITTSVSLQNQTGSFLVSTSPTTPLALLTAAPIQHESLAATSTTMTKTTGKTTSVVKNQKMPTQVKMNTRKPLNCTGSAKVFGTGKTSVKPSFIWSFPTNK